VGQVITKRRHGYPLVRKGAVFVPFGGRWSLTTFFKGYEQVAGESPAQRVQEG
jgi:hypothetical protein